jgi:hypothetical protein
VKNRLKKYYPVFIVIFFASCFSLQGLKHKEFIYYTNDVKNKLVIEVPSKFTEEKIYLLPNGEKEQRYSYVDGAVLYFGYGTSWSSLNIENINRQANNYSKIIQEKMIVFKGKESNNSDYWKEIQIDNFRFGYRNVSKNKLPEFDHAVSALYIK